MLLVAAGGGGDPALDLVFGRGQFAFAAAALRRAALLAKTAVVGLDRLQFRQPVLAGA